MWLQAGQPGVDRGPRCSRRWVLETKPSHDSAHCVPCTGRKRHWTLRGAGRSDRGCLRRRSGRSRCSQGDPGMQQLPREQRPVPRPGRTREPVQLVYLQPCYRLARRLGRCVGAAEDEALQGDWKQVGAGSRRTPHSLLVRQDRGLETRSHVTRRLILSPLASAQRPSSPEFASSLPGKPNLSAIP